MTRTEQRQYYRQIEAKRRTLLPFCQAAARKALKDQLRPVFSALQASDVVSPSFAEYVTDTPVRHALEAMYTKVLPPFAELSYINLTRKAIELELITKDDRTDPDAPFRRFNWLQRARNYISEVAGERIRKITETTRNKVRQFLGDAIEEGWSVQRTAKELAAYTQAINKERAVVIARTEILGASNRGSLDGAKATGLMLEKGWLSTKDKRTRDDHKEANGQWVDINDLFYVGGEYLAHPGDTSHGATAKNVVKCRCTQTYRPKSA